MVETLIVIGLMIFAITIGTPTFAWLEFTADHSTLEDRLKAAAILVTYGGLYLAVAINLGLAIMKWAGVK